jgi:hypothetical protein
MTATLTIAHGFNGPPDSGQGGYSAGLLANVLGGSDVEVTLRKPPPLGTPMNVHRDGDRLTLLDGDTLVAEAQRSETTAALPDPVSFADAEAASHNYPGLREHIFPTCLVCGPDRTDQDGMRLFPGPVDGRSVSAAPWVASPRFAGEDESLRHEFVWAALDCPSGWSTSDLASGRPLVLGRISARLVRPVVAGERYVVVGWPGSEDGRKVYAGSAIFDEDGAPCAYAATTWIRLRE